MSEGAIFGKQSELQLTELLSSIFTIPTDFRDLFHDEIKVLLFKITGLLQYHENFDSQILVGCKRPKFLQKILIKDPLQSKILEHVSWSLD